MYLSFQYQRWVVCQNRDHPKLHSNSKMTLLVSHAVFYIILASVLPLIFLSALRVINSHNSHN